MPAQEAATKRRRTFAELEKLIQSEPEVTHQSCSDLQASLDENEEVLDNLEDFPANRRAAIRAAVLKQMRATMAQMRQQHCPID